MRQTGARLTLLILLAITSLLSSACLPTASLTGEAPLTVLGTLSTVPDTVVEARISLSRENTFWKPQSRCILTSLKVHFRCL